MRVYVKPSHPRNESTDYRIYRGSFVPWQFPASVSTSLSQQGDKGDTEIMIFF